MSRGGRKGPTLLLLGLALGPKSASADEPDRLQAKEYFRAGAAAYAAGDYLAAIQALDAAYRVTPLTAITFSIAQAERRQYFVSREPVRLRRAIELYRDYLRREPQGSRRADATDALAQLEPLSVALSVTESSAPVAPVESVKTRVMVTSEAPGAVVVLDDRASVRSPLIAEVTPGTHSVQVSAPGYFPSARQLVAVAGELVPIEVPLRERAPIVFVQASADVDLYVDGSYRGKAGTVPRLELTSGVHTFDFAKKGHITESVRAELGRGSTRRISIDLEHTPQRTAALALFGVSAGAFVSGAVLGAIAIAREDSAQSIVERRSQANISPDDLASYRDAVEDRDRFRIAATASIVGSLGALAVGLLLHELDAPAVSHAPALRGSREPRLHLGLRERARGAEASLGGALEF